MSSNLMIPFPTESRILQVTLALFVCKCLTGFDTEFRNRNLCSSSLIVSHWIVRIYWPSFIVNS